MRVEGHEAMTGVLTASAVRGRLAHMSAAQAPSSIPAQEKGPSQQTLCVLWRGAESAPPRELLAMLGAKKGVEIVDCANAYLALARVFKQERLNDRAPATEAGAGLPARVPIIFLMVRPAELAGAASVHRSLVRFAPHAACWMYENAGTSSLRSVTQADVDGWAAGDGSGTLEQSAPNVRETPQVRPQRTGAAGGAVGASATRGVRTVREVPS